MSWHQLSVLFGPLLSTISFRCYLHKKYCMDELAGAGSQKDEVALPSFFVLDFHCFCSPGHPLKVCLIWALSSLPVFLIVPAWVSWLTMCMNYYILFVTLGRKMNNIWIYLMNLVTKFTCLVWVKRGDLWNNSARNIFYLS